MFEKMFIPVANCKEGRGIKRAILAFRNLGVESLILFHVQEGGLFFRKSGQSWFQCQLKEEFEKEGIEVKTETGNGHTATAIAERALFENVYAIYLKARKKWNIETLLLGSVSRDLLRLTDVPTFVHKKRPQIPPDGTGIRHRELVILYATDLEKASYRPLPYVKDFKGAKCYILHIRDRRADPISERMWKKRVDEELSDLEEELRADFTEVLSEQRIGDPATEVVNTSDRINADIIVMGRKEPSFFSAPMGSTAERIVNNSAASIFLVP